MCEDCVGENDERTGEFDVDRSLYRIELLNLYEILGCSKLMDYTVLRKAIKCCLVYCVISL